MICQLKESHSLDVPVPLIAKVDFLSSLPTVSSFIIQETVFRSIVGFLVKYEDPRHPSSSPEKSLHINNYSFYYLLFLL